MLVLSRRRKESIMIWDDVKVTILDIHANEVRVGIEAPRDIPVRRKEMSEQHRGEPELNARKLAGEQNIESEGQDR